MDAMVTSEPHRPLSCDDGVSAEVGVDVDDEHMEVVAAAGSAWVASDHTPLRRISVRALALEATIDAGGGIPFVARGGLVWGARPDALWAIDPATNGVTRTVPLGQRHRDPSRWTSTAAMPGSRLAGPGTSGSSLRLDLEDGRVVGEYPVSLPAAVRIAGDRVWVASYLTNELLGFAR